jgi:hypothetical protein
VELFHRDFLGRRSTLKSIAIEGDSLLWVYQSGFFTQHASVPLSSLISLRLEGGELFWTYRIFPTERTGSVDDLVETLSALGRTQSENDHLIQIYWKLLQTVHPREYAERRSSQGDPRQQSSSKRDRYTTNDSARSSNSKDQDSRRDPGSASNHSGNDSYSNSTSRASPENRDDLKRAIIILGASLSVDKRRKLKSSLRLLYHPDHGGSQDFFITLESVFAELEW